MLNAWPLIKPWIEDTLVGVNVMLALAASAYFIRLGVRSLRSLFGKDFQRTCVLQNSRQENTAFLVPTDDIVVTTAFRTLVDFANAQALETRNQVCHLANRVSKLEALRYEVWVGPGEDAGQQAMQGVRTKSFEKAE